MVENGRSKMEDKKCKLKIINNQLSIDNFAQRGFTLVELMMTLVMSSIVLISIYVIVSKSHEYINDAKLKIQAQRDFSLIETLLSSKIRQSLHGQHEIYNNYSDYVASQPTQSSGTCMKLFFVSGDSVVLYQDNQDFKIMNTDSTFTNLVPGVVDSLMFTKKTKSIETKLSLSQGTWSLENTFVAAFRNFSDGLVGNRKCELVIQSSQVPASLTDFAVLLTDTTLPSEMFDADGANPALNGGGDIKFSSDEFGNNRLSCEIVTFTTDNNPALGKAEIWVKVPSVSASSNTSIWVWYDASGESQPAANEAYGSESVWDNNYVGVWHLNETVVDEQTTGTHTDATSNNNDGTQNGNDDIAGKIGTAQDFDGTDDYVSVPEDNSLDTPTQLTASYWHKPPTSTGVHPRTLDKQGSWDIKYNEANGTGNPQFSQQNGGGDAKAGNPTEIHIDDTGVWQHFAVTFNSGTVTWHLNGADVGLFSSDVVSSNVLTNSGFYIGGWSGAQLTVGPIDEARLANVARSGGWITAAYNNQNSPSTFVIEGTPEAP